MPKKINVLRTFHFSRAPRPDEKLGVERIFTPGEHEIDDETAAHPYIAGLADGRIESPEAALVRVQAAAAAAKKAEEDNAKTKAAAEAALARFMQMKGADSAASAEAIEKELNTPVSQLPRAGGGAKKTATA